MIAITHPIKQMINNQHTFLASMLERFPYLLAEWIKKQEEEVEQLAKEFAGDDYEVYRDTYNSEISRIDPCYDEEQLFNQAMLIMVYSYYESLVLKISKEIGTAPRPSKIAEKQGVTLDDKFVEIATYLHQKIRPLRNQLCHNNNGTLFDREDENEKEAILELVNSQVIEIIEERIYIANKQFIVETLESEYELLIRLAEICGFKTIIK